MHLLPVRLLPVRLLTVTIAAGDVEMVSDRAWQAGASAIWEQATPHGGVELRVGVPDERVPAVRAALGGDGVVDVTDADPDHLVTRRAPLQVAGRSVEVVVPATVFGDGAHPTTRACLARLLRLTRPGGRVLDIGCGTGILAVAAALAGADVEAIDVDPTAVAATASNATAAGVGDRIAASETPIEDVDAAFDLVVANVSAAVTAAAAPRLARLVEPGGRLVVSGILAAQWPAVAASLTDFAVDELTVEDGWVTAVLRHRRRPAASADGVRPAGS